MSQDDKALLSRLQSHRVEFVVIGGFRILSIDALIATKEAVGRDRDREAVRYLRAIKERNEQRGKS